MYSWKQIHDANSTVNNTGVKVLVLGRREAIIALLDELVVAVAITIIILALSYAFDIISLRTAVISGCIIGAILAYIGYLAGRAQLKKPSVGAEALVGKKGIVIEELAPEGTILIEGEYWKAVSINGKRVPRNKQVVVKGFRGLVLYVEEIEGK